MTAKTGYLNHRADSKCTFPPKPGDEGGAFAEVEQEDNVPLNLSLTSSLVADGNLNRNIAFADPSPTSCTTEQPTGRCAIPPWTASFRASAPDGLRGRAVEPGTGEAASEVPAIG
jgi:hypothetical protein